MNPRAAKVVENRQEARGIFQLALDLDEGAPLPAAGQFYMVRTGKGHDPLLRRPLGSLKAEQIKERGLRLYFLYQVRGKGTALLSGLLPGEKIDVIGPLGSGWRLEEPPSRVIAVAGGMGIVPLYAALQEIFGSKKGVRTELVYGARSGPELVLREELKEVADRVVLCTEDGCIGEQGMAPRFLNDLLAEGAEGAEKPLVLACGPRPMLRKVRQICADHDLDCQVSMEARMGCGMGACLTCSIPGASGDNLRVCREGPVFDAADIDWEKLDESP